MIFIPHSVEFRVKMFYNNSMGLFILRGERSVLLLSERYFSYESKDPSAQRGSTLCFSSPES